MNDFVRPGFDVNAAWDKLTPPSERVQEIRDKQQQSYEQAIVAKFIKATGTTTSPRHLKEEAMALYQTDTLNLHWFWQAYPNFPLRLRIAKVDWAFKAMSDLFLTFEKSVIYKALQAFAEEENFDDRTHCFGIVFSVVKHGDMVLHNYMGHDPNPLEQPKKRDRASFRYETDVPGVEYILETLPRLLTKLGDRWYH